MSEKVAVFDIGDTLLPSEKLINETIKEHAAGAPDMDIYQFNIYRPAEIRHFLEINGLEADAEEITKSYHEKVKLYLEERDIFSLFEKINREHGFVGFISDNTLECKYFWEDMLREKGLNPRIVVSEQVGAEKPSSKIFERFLKLSEYDNPGKYVYFGNSVERDSAVEDVGMKFVWVNEHMTGEETIVGPKISEFNEESVLKALEEVENQ
jgi:FMN phosphatase YigB (HAD superfamily)